MSDSQPTLASPCIGLCRLDPGGSCTGCRRSLDQIARWTTMSDAERTAIMAALTGHPCD